MPVKAGHTIRGRQRPSSDDAQHLPTLQAAALGWLLLLSSGTAAWYAIVDPVWRTPVIISSPVTTSLQIRPTSPPNSRFFQGGTALTSAVPAGASADELVLATIDPILRHPAEMGVETAALSTPATVAPSQTTHKPARDPVVSAVEASPSASPSARQLPTDIIGVRPGDDLERPITVRNGETKGPIRNRFVELYPEEPQRGWPNISTASFARKTQSEDLQSDDSSADLPNTKGDAGSHAGAQDPHSDGAPSGGSQGKKDSKSDKAAHDSDGPASAGPKGGGDAGPGGGATAGGKGPKAGKDKPSAGKSASGGPQDNHNSNRGGPSPGKADQDKNSKSDVDKKGKGKDKDRDKGGKDKGDKAKGLH
jgi:hypothetical protein